MEVKPDWGCDSGLFLRSSESGEAYQVTLDYLPVARWAASTASGSPGSAARR